MAKFKKITATQDDSGHWYLIPIELKDEFILDSENEEMADNGEFGAKYGQYMTGGDLNLAQLYVEDPEAEDKKEHIINAHFHVEVKAVPLRDEIEDFIKRMTRLSVEKALMDTVAKVSLKD